ncbi:MAG: acylphosphatase [Pirellulaceae bacterium]
MTHSQGLIRRRVLFTGHVQGVGFRYRTVHVARQFAVTGFVRNLDDGRVELVCESQHSEGERFLAAVQAEMEGYIRDVQVETSPARGEFQEFGVRG